MEFHPYIKLPNLDVKNSNNIHSIRGGDSGSSAEEKSEFERDKTRGQIVARLRKRLYTVLTTSNQSFDKVSSYTSLYNTWITGLRPHYEVTNVSQYGDDNGRRVWTVRRTLQFMSTEGIVKYEVERHGFVQKLVLDQVCKELLGKFLCPYTQGDNIPSKESIQGDATQSSDKNQNTIITRDQQITESESTVPPERSLVNIASSEPTHQFEGLVGRWMPLKKITVSTTDAMDTKLATYYLPETFLSDQSVCAPNTIPFETFVYGQYDIAMKFVVNANKFHCGKVIVSVKFDSYQADDINTGFQAHLSRKHVILDLSANNEGYLEVPFRYHRAFVRNQTHSTATVGVRSGKYASVYVSVLSQLRTGKDGANDIDIRPFYMIKRADFAGMSYKVALTQMDIVGELAHALPTKSLKTLIRGVEKSLDQLGRSHNQDKPTENRATIIIPRPRLHFPNGKGMSDAAALRMNPTALTSFNEVKGYSDEPKTTLDIARIWGLRSTFTWSQSSKEGDVLFNAVIDPTSRSYGNDYEGQPTPLEYVASFYQFWSGPIELRFDIVSNSFHTGAIIISAEFNRTSVDTDECQSHSTYTKVFHLGDQRSVDFRIPYIYDTVMRRSTTLAFCPIIDSRTTTDAIKMSAISIRPESKMRVKVRVINALRPVAAAPQEIDVLVFMRAGKNFVLHGLKQSSFWDSRDIVPIDSFPNDSYAPVTKPAGVPSRKKREAHVYTEEEVSDGKHVPPEDRFLPKSIANRWNERRAITPQMDNGEKDDEDSTDNFAHGISSFGVQNLDSQVGIKDILRRPVLLFNNVSIDSKATGFFIPVMPPSRMMQFKSGDTTTSFSSIIGQTPQAAIMNLFRFWRGSMRYTIMLYGGANSTPVFVTHVPHTGVRLFGNKTINGVAAHKTPIYGSGLSTDIIVPCVNPTINVEIPYDTENNWTLTFDEDALRNYAWRDKGDGTSGHLVVSALEDRKMSVWWSAGDDFEVANFYGIPSTKSNHWAYQFSDEHARVQMDDVGEDPDCQTYYYGRPEDFRFNNVSTAVKTLWNSASETITPKRLLTAAICATPVIGPAYTTATVLDTVGNVKTSLNTALANMEKGVAEELSKISSKFGTTLDSLTHLIQNSVDSVLQGLQCGAAIASYCYDVILDILIAWTDKSWTAIGVGIVRFLGKVMAVRTVSHLMSYATQLGEVLALAMQPAVVRVQAPPTEATIVGVLAGLVGSVVGVSINPTRYTTLSRGLLERLTDSRGISYLMGVLRFVEATFVTIRDMVLGTLGYVTPEAAALKMLSGSSPTIGKFITEAQIITSEANAAMMQDPGYRHRFWSTVMQAYQIQKLLISVPTAHASPILSRLCTEVIKIGNEKFVDISSAPVRYEPFVICIEGEAGLGKSEMVEDLVSNLLGAIDLKRPHSGAIYYRMPGSRFWSGYRDQPVVVYDDWMNLTDTALACQQISELYQLKSTSMFIPEMAHLEEKKIRGNPLIVVLLCNEAFPKSAITNIAHTPKAIYRRRDVLLKAFRKEAYVGVDLRSMSSDDQITFAHLEFQKYRDQTEPRSLASQKADYAATSLWLQGKFKKWHAQEQIKVARRLKLTQAGMHNAGIDQIRLDDPFQLYYSVGTEIAQIPENNQNAFLPSDILANEVIRIAAALEAHQAATPHAVEIEEPYDPFLPSTQSLWDSVRVATLGMLTTRYSLSEICRMTVQELDKCVDWLYGVSNEVVRCNICLEENPLYLRCSNSTREANHAVCRACYEHGLALGHGIPNCPVCRSECVEIYRDEQQILAMTLLGRWALRSSCAAVVVVDRIRRLLGGSWSYLFAAVARYGLLVGTTLVGVSREEAMSAYGVASIVDRLESVTRVASQVLVQSDCFGDEEDEVEPPLVVDQILECAVREEVLEDLLLNSVLYPNPCLHRYLLGQECHARYNGGKFLLFTGSERLAIPEEPCEGDCAFDDMDILRQFYANFLGYHGPQLRCSVVGFINAPDNKEYHLGQIPKALRPSWMRVDVVLEREIENITRSSWWELLSDAWANYRTLIVAVSGVSTAIAGIIMMRGWFSAVDKPMTQVISSGDEQTRNLARTVRTLQRVKPSGPHFQQAIDTPELDTVVKKYIARNYFTFELAKEGQSKKLLNACGLYNRVAILPRHYVKELRKRVHDGWTIRGGPSLLPHEWHEYNFDEIDFTISNTTDLALWRAPPAFGMFKDIRKFVASDDDLSRPITTEGSIMIAPNRRNPTLKEVSLNILGVQNSEVVEDYDGERFEAYDVLCYNYSQPGACGSLVTLNRSTRPIVAMHFAGLGDGSHGEGFGVILTKEALGELSQDRMSVTQMEDFDGESMENAKIILPDANVGYLGSLSQEKSVFLPRKSKIRPSVIQNVGELKPLTEPCILDKTDPRYEHDITPLVAGASKHGRLTKDFKTSQVKRAANALWDGWLSHMKPLVVEPVILTPEQAATGFKDVEYYDPMILNTSAGYPYILGDRKQKGDYISFDRDGSGRPIGAKLDPIVVEALEVKKQLRYQGIIPFTPFIDTLKDERRKPEKVRKVGGTRVFCNPPVDYVIAMRQNFLHFTAAFMADRFNQQHSVGINVTGTEWTQLARRLIAKSPNNICTIDYANFGPGFNAGVAEQAMELMIKWTLENVRGVNECELRVLLYECLYSQHICSNTVYYQKCGSPSGAPITVVINTLVNLLLIAIAWEELTKKQISLAGEFLWEEYRSNIALFCYGDDLIMSVTDKYRDVFNSRTITRFFAQYDIVATDAGKTEEVTAYGPITQATFLKHGFKKHEVYDHIWQSALEWTSINDTTQWIWECADYKLATYENCRAAIQLAHGHGREKFDKFKEQVNCALRKKGCPTIVMTWDEVDTLFYPDLYY